MHIEAPNVLALCIDGIVPTPPPQLRYLPHARIMEEEYEISREEYNVPTIDEVEDNETDSPAQNPVITGHCVSDIWVHGWESLDRMNVKSSRTKQ